MKSNTDKKSASNKDRRVINLPKDEFDLIKEHCEKNSLDMVKWMSKNSLEKLNTKMPEKRVVASEARKIHECACRPVELPINWIDLALDKIDKDIKWAITGCSFAPRDKDVSYIQWDGKVAVVNNYNVNRWIQLLPDQIELVKIAVMQLGFSFEKQTVSYDNSVHYKIGW